MPIRVRCTENIGFDVEFDVVQPLDALQSRDCVTDRVVSYEDGHMGGQNGQVDRLYNGTNK